jgi:hypothetical protein
VWWLFACFLLTPKKLPELMGFFFAKLFSLPSTGKKKAFWECTTIKKAGPISRDRLT